MTNSVRRLEKHEAAWLAAAIDGEGSIGLYDYGREGRRVSIQMGNTHQGFVQRFKDLIGCGSTVYRHTFGKSHMGRKPMYHFVLKGSKRCCELLRQVIPFLIIKKAKAKAIVRHVESIPFGRWCNGDISRKLRAKKKMKQSWKDPEIRARRLAGMLEGRRRKRLRELEVD